MTKEMKFQFRLVIIICLNVAAFFIGIITPMLIMKHKTPSGAAAFLDVVMNYTGPDAFRFVLLASGTLYGLSSEWMFNRIKLSTPASRQDTDPKNPG